mmetsp:Transcript_60396/g.141185  ORF Transcript_60396/g.141185 Transcript_60396/m.141185 type:complete len:455 (-) Transcript_60396:155-1519(-)
MSNTVNGKALPATLKVKNTFIDVRPDCVDDDDYVSTVSSMAMRQFSEPAPTRQFSSRQTSGGDVQIPMGMPLNANSLIEEDEESDVQEDEEGSKGVKGLSQRQDTADAFNNSPINRQVTEIHWPTWGMPMMQGVEGAYPPPFEPNALFPFPGAKGFPTASALTAEVSQQAAQWPQALGGDASGVAQVAQAEQAVDAQMAGSKDIPSDWHGKTTVMLRNLPNKYNQQMLLEDLNTSGFLGTFDFLYLPIDPETNANRGYCFINFTDPSFAWMLKCTYEGRKMGRFNSDKVVSVAPAALQGFEANYAHYSTARVNRGDPSTRPLFLRECAMSSFNQEQQRRRGGRRSQGSLIDIAARQQRKNQVVFPEGGYISLPASGQGPSPPGVVDAGTGRKGVTAKTDTLKRFGGKGPTTTNPKGSSEDTPVPRFCPFCGGETKPDFRFCQFCGASLAFGPPE